MVCHLGRKSCSAIAAIPDEAQKAPMGQYEWNGASPTVAQRVVAGFYGAGLLILSASSYFDWRVVGSYDRQATAGWVIIGLVLFIRFMPTVRKSD